MPAFLTSLGAKLGAVALVAVLAFGGGLWAGARLKQPEVDAAKLALANQQKADAQAIAVANTEAANDLIAAQKANDEAELAHADTLRQIQTSTAQAETEITQEAAEPGQDGPVAPVLAGVMRNIQQSQEGQK